MAVEETVNVAVDGLATVEAIVQVGTLVPVVGVTAQVSPTLPRNAPVDSTLIEEVPLLPAVSEIAPLLVSVNPATFTVSGTVVAAVVAPEVPVTVTT